MYSSALIYTVCYMLFCFKNLSQDSSTISIVIIIIMYHIYVQQTIMYISFVIQMHTSNPVNDMTNFLLSPQYLHTELHETGSTKNDVKHAITLVMLHKSPCHLHHKWSMALVRMCANLKAIG